jgi:hypothetical protein
MTRAEQIELLAIALLAPAAWLVWPPTPTVVPLWQLTLELSALLLVQSLVRDVAILLRSRRSPSLRKEAQCFCLESTIGVTGVVIGAALALLGSPAQVRISQWGACLAALGTMAVGFAIKDLVISWGPLAVRREKDHLNLIVRWKSKS